MEWPKCIVGQNCSMGHNAIGNHNGVLSCFNHFVHVCVSVGVQRE